MSSGNIVGRLEVIAGFGAKSSRDFLRTVYSSSFSEVRGSTGSEEPSPRSCEYIFDEWIFSTTDNISRKNLDDHVAGEFLFVNTAKTNEGLQYPGKT